MQTSLRRRLVSRLRDEILLRCTVSLHSVEFSTIPNLSFTLKALFSLNLQQFLIFSHVKDYKNFLSVFWLNIYTKYLHFIINLSYFYFCITFSSYFIFYYKYSLKGNFFLLFLNFWHILYKMSTSCTSILYANSLILYLFCEFASHL